MFRSTLTLSLFFLFASSVVAGTGYEVTSTDGDKTITYMVKFGGGRGFEQLTAFDPVSKEFVYLTWPRGDEKPEPAGKIWDHQTGRTMDLYKFPNVEHPLPAIPRITEMKVCPLTGDKNFVAKAVLAYD